MATILDRYRAITKLPAGKYIFSKLVGFNAPFFSKINPRFVELREAYCETTIKDRRAVRNHLGTINAGALCSMAEMTGGLALDTVVPQHMRWIPKEMTVHYHKKATGQITAVSEFDSSIVVPGDVAIPIRVSDSNAELVFSADITFYISEKKA